MDGPPSRPGEPETAGSSAASTFAWFAARREAGEDVDFETLVAEHPEQAEKLRALHAEWSQRDTATERPDRQASAGPLAPGQRVGEFRLVKRIGRGGMGEVWEAVQESLERTVALKVMLPGSLNERTLKYFAREARAGGRLSHPGIVAVYASGESDGVHWIAMEMVSGGITLGNFLDQMREQAELPDDYYRQVAALLAKVADAIEVAHTEDVIHRDLKPHNVLIAPDDQPKVADFGLARVVSEHSLSQTGDFAGTYFYMSPEQVAAKRMGLDHRTDVFSLGVMLYELLTLVRPFEGDSTHQIAEKILLHDPPDPQQIRSRVPRDLTVICGKAMEKKPSARYQTMAELAADLRRHLAHEPILAKPPTVTQRAVKWMRRNPTKFAATGIAAVALVAISGLAWQLVDANRDLEARTEQLKTSNAILLTRTEQLTTTNKNLETRTGELKAANTDLEVQTAEAQQQRDVAQKAKEEAAVQRDQAEQRAEELQQVSDFQAEQLSGVDVEAMGLTIRAMVLERARAAGQRAGREPEVLETEQTALEKLLAGADFTELALDVLDQEVFERALEGLEGFGNQPLVQARLLQVVANTLRELGLREEADKPQEQALEIRRRELGDEHPDTLTSVTSLGQLLQDQGEFDKAEPVMHEALEKSRQTLGDEHIDTLTSINNLGNLLLAQARTDDAELLIREALEGFRSTLGDQHRRTLTSINNLGGLLYSTGQLSEAEQLMREALKGKRSTLGDEHMDTLTSINNLGGLLLRRGKIDEAAQLIREALNGRRSTLGGLHPHTLSSINNLAFLLKRQGKVDEVEPLMREALEGRRRKLGDEHPNTLDSIAALGRLLRAQGKVDEAEELIRDAVEGFRSTRGNQHLATVMSINDLGLLVYGRGKLDEAEPLMREAMAGMRILLGDDHRNTLSSINNLGMLLKRQGEYDEAEPLLREAMEGTRSTIGAEHPDTLTSIYNLGDLLYAQGRFDGAEELYREAMEGQRRTLGDEHSDTLLSISNLGHLLKEQGKLDDAESLMREAMAGMRSTLGAEHPDTLTSIYNMAELLCTQGKLDDAEELARELIGTRPTTDAWHINGKKLLDAIAAAREEKD